MWIASGQIRNWLHHIICVRNYFYLLMILGIFLQSLFVIIHLDNKYLPRRLVSNRHLIYEGFCQTSAFRGYSLVPLFLMFLKTIRSVQVSFFVDANIYFCSKLSFYYQVLLVLLKEFKIRVMLKASSSRRLWRADMDWQDVGWKVGCPSKTSSWHISSMSAFKSFSLNTSPASYNYTKIT